MEFNFNDERIKEFVQARNEALFSLDEKKIREFMKKYTSLKPPKSRTVFWAMVYKAICNINEATPEIRTKAKIWLKRRGFKESIR